MCSSQQTPWRAQAFNALTSPGNETQVSPVLGFCSFFYSNRDRGCGRGRDGGPTDLLPGGGLIEIPRFLPKKKREREELRGARGHPSAQKPSLPPEVGRAVSSLEEPEQSQDGALLADCFPLLEWPRSPRPLKSSVPALMSAVGGGMQGPRHPPASPLGGAGRLRSRALDFTASRRQNRGVRSIGGTSPVPCPLGKRGRPGPGAGPVPAISPAASPAPPVVTRARPALGGRWGLAAAGAGWWLRRGHLGHAGARQPRTPAAPGCADTPGRRARGCRAWGLVAGPRQAAPGRPGGAGGRRARRPHPRPRRPSRACRC